jgi:ABC-type transporter Mla subunit MlaD
MRTPISRVERSAGAFLVVTAIVGVVGLVGAARRIDVLDLFREGFVLYAVSDSGYGVAVGSPVRLRGVEVGTVMDLALVNDPGHPGRPVRLTIRVQDRSAPFLGDQTIAAIVEPPMGTGAPPFGTASVDLHPAGDKPLGRRAVILAEGQESMVNSMARMNHDVSALTERFMRTLAEMDKSFAAVRQLADSFESGGGVAGRLLHDPKMAEDLQGTFRQAKEVTAGARDLVASAQGITQRTGGLLDEAHAVSQSGKQTLAKADTALDLVPRLMASTERTLAASEELLKSLRGSAAAAPELLRKFDASLDETNRLVQAAQNSILFRSTMPDRPPLQTATEERPPVVAAPPSPPPSSAGTPSPRPPSSAGTPSPRPPSSPGKEGGA